MLLYKAGVCVNGMPILEAYTVQSMHRRFQHLGVVDMAPDTMHGVKTIYTIL